jgi:hypothetical protein
MANADGSGRGVGGGMTPSERLRIAFDRGIPDRTPVAPKIWVDLAAALTGTDLRRVVEDLQTALNVVADAGLSLGVDAVRQFHWPARRLEERDGQLIEVDGSGRRLGAVDMMGGLATHLDDVADYRLDDPVTMSYHHYWDSSEPVVKSIADARSIAVPTGDLFDDLGWAKRQDVVRERVGQRMALIADISSATMAFHICMRGMQPGMLDLMDNPGLVHAVMEKGVEIAVAKGKYWLDYGLKILRLNDSVGNMSVMSPAHWREFVFPHMKDVCTELHRYDPDARIYCHICGNVLPIAEDLVATGLDCIGPLDPLGGMSPGDVRHRVGNDIALMGGVDTQSFVNGSPDDVRMEASACIEKAGRDGAFILGSGCVIPRGASRENLVALVEAAQLA